MHMLFHMLKFFCLALLASSCATTLKAGEPAVITNSGDGVISELTEVVSEAMNGAKITLAHDSLSKTNTLFIERAPHKSLAHNPAMGRRMDMPDHFTLSKSGNACLLTHTESGKTYRLKKAKCRTLVEE
ncbi:MAG: hypothetical protein JKX72_04395 [Robiginitomaculum sp.]|nr:hypothetical protein [Robiginitomaculum sp.]